MKKDARIKADNTSPALRAFLLLTFHFFDPFS